MKLKSEVESGLNLMNPRGSGGRPDRYTSESFLLARSND